MLQSRSSKAMRNAASQFTGESPVYIAIQEHDERWLMATNTLASTPAAEMDEHRALGRQILAYQPPGNAAPQDVEGRIQDLAHIPSRATPARTSCRQNVLDDAHSASVSLVWYRTWLRLCCRRVVGVRMAFQIRRQIPSGASLAPSTQPILGRALTTYGSLQQRRFVCRTLVSVSLHQMFGRRCGGQSCRHASFSEPNLG